MMQHDDLVTTIAPPQINIESLLKPEQPSMWNVYALNDNTTSRWFVMRVLREVFGMNEKMAEDTMMTAHRTGKAFVASFYKDVAEKKIQQAHELAATSPHANTATGEACELRFTMEEE